jgi:hypothetical protein
MKPEDLNNIILECISGVHSCSFDCYGEFGVCCKRCPAIHVCGFRCTKSEREEVW